MHLHFRFNLIMKKLALFLLLATAAASCDNKQIKNTTDTIKSADSLFRNVKDGYKTLDSISQVFNDSAKVDKEISRQKEIIEKHVDLKNLNIKNLDSLTTALKKVTENVENGTETMKTIDSATEVIKNSDNPLETIGVITETINKTVHKNTIKKAQQAPSVNQQTTTDQAPEIYEENIGKTARLEIEVNDVSAARNKFAAALRDYQADIVSENISDSEGTKRQYLTAKIPAKYFEQVLRQTETLGNTNTKSIESSGTRYDPNQMYDLAITFRENNSGVIPGGFSSSTDSLSSSPSDTLKSEKDTKNRLWWLLIPAGLIGIVVWVITSMKARKREEELRNIKEQQRILTEKLKATEKTEQNIAEQPDQSKNPDQPDDYSRFMPK